MKIALILIAFLVASVIIAIEYGERVQKAQRAILKRNEEEVLALSSRVITMTSMLMKERVATSKADEDELFTLLETIDSELLYINTGDSSRLS